MKLSINKLYPNPNQPRKDFDQAGLEELAMSIRQYGVLEPLVVTKRGDRYMIVAGERRFRASLLAGLKEVPAEIIEADDALVEELALLENIQRQDLNIIEEAKGYQSLLDRGWTKEELARKMGFKQVWRIDERTSLLNLAPEHQKLVINGTIGHSQAFEMSRVAPDRQALVLKKILAGELNSYNKLRSFVDGLILIEQQGNIFELNVLTEEQKKALNDFDALLTGIERFIKKADDLEHFKKAVFHSNIRPERLDLIIKHLMKLRKLVLTGKGVKDALAA